MYTHHQTVISNQQYLGGRDGSRRQKKKILCFLHDLNFPDVCFVKELLIYFVERQTELSDPEDFSCLATIWWAQSLPSPSRRGCAQMQLPARPTGASNRRSGQVTPRHSCRPTSDCPLPKQTSCPSWQGHCHAYSLKRESNWVGGGGLESFWSPDPHEPRLPPPERPSTGCWDQTPYVFSASALRYWPALALSVVCSSSSNDTVFIKTIYMFSQIADIKENHPWELNKLS